jgi:hypothetical protein
MTSTSAIEAHVFGNTTRRTAYNDKILNTPQTSGTNKTNHKCHQYKEQGRNIQQKHAHESALT